jgi:NhaA family Na+:H+ antiporter
MITMAVDSEHTSSQWFFTTEVLGSIALMIASVAAVIIANSGLADTYQHWLHMEIALSFGHQEVGHSLLHWINDGLMAIFFFTVGLEIKREVLVGELASTRIAMLPVMAAAGGMLVPGLIYTFFNFGQPGMDGWGIPVATDIAFSLGAIALLGSRLPVGIRVFLTAFAIADDLGAVMIIALFYNNDIVMPYLLSAGGCVLILFIANMFLVRWLPFYIVMGVITWVFVLGSGVHATVAGVVMAMLVPARAKYNPILFVNRTRRIIDRIQTVPNVDDQWYSVFIRPEHLHSIHALEMVTNDVSPPLQRFEHALHPWVVFAILPLFAFFNAGLSLEGMPLFGAIGHPITLGCTLGLLIGKPLGVTLAAYLAVRGGIASLPDGVRWPHIIGAGMLGGIGFTMSLFISGLSFTDPQFLNYSKLGVLLGSILSALAGLSFLGYYAFFRKKSVAQDTTESNGTPEAA